MTIDEAMTTASRKLDAMIEARLQALEARIRADQLASGPPPDEDEPPPDPFGSWTRITVEDVLARERAHLAVWRIESLAKIREMVTAFDGP
jgi:hypothetical protein